MNTDILESLQQTETSKSDRISKEVRENRKTLSG